MRILIAFSVSLFSSVMLAQSPEQDEIQFQSAVDWLGSKLNYVYYDDVGEKWWSNTFYVNDNREITIKHIASDKPNTANIRSKTYTIRTFRIQDINPKSLKITEVAKTKGRLVKGKMLELRTYGFQDLIHKTINNRRGSSTSFLFLSFPEVLNDSISNYAEIVKQKFEQAILASTKVYPSNTASDSKTIFNILEGNFKSDEGHLWNAQKVKPDVLKIDQGTGNIEYFGFDQDQQQFYLLDINSDGVQTQFYVMNNQDILSLSSTEETVFTFYTLHSFSFKGTRFFRQ
ncbi:hypothetical protein [Ekhidna sp.]|jgi:hypothetical protein|uniref:hypothetical protein n=1 Tax=Ekhidna sp. TaxID=2608089 RepID=UPI0032EF17FA